MPKKEWGVKRVCPTTSRRFYDLNRDPVISPYTGETIKVDRGPDQPPTPEPDDVDGGKIKDINLDIGDGIIVEEDVLEEEENISLDDIADVSTEEQED
ncbi:MAG: TIGR02300 family protein [Roseovarius sp.]|nr:TIGR02300 family protein [Roseovarius sp.]MCY4208711.1 TIGR02300 family protein [Roseovarius sp.]MCY4292759.1 TIGR02300 family protein [Roseovarius sp.]MCY4315635.1 TIGR02300 family protein [Roseovarius sp.]